MLVVSVDTYDENGDLSFSLTHKYPELNESSSLSEVSGIIRPMFVGMGYMEQSYENVILELAEGIQSYQDSKSCNCGGCGCSRDEEDDDQLELKFD
jgi:hypothetical protein